MIAPVTAATTVFAEDPRLPARDRLLDEGFMSSRFEMGDAQCRRVRTKYRLGESLRVSYEVTSRTGPSARISLRGFPAEDFDLRSSTAADSSSLRTPPDLFLPDLSALGWIFPNDRKLSSLSRFWNDPDVRLRALGTETSSLDLVAYAPEKSATVRCGAAGRTIGFAKLYAKGGAHASMDIYRQLRPPLAEIGIAMPNIEAFDRELGLVLLSPVAGETISSRHDATDWYRLGCAAAKLHMAIPPSGLPRFERATMPRLTGAARFVSAARPDVSRLVEQLLDALAAAQDRFDRGPDVLLHGDLHGKNVLCAGRNLTFIDFDQAAAGQAAAELGSAVAALRYDALTLAPSATAGTSGMPITTFETHLLEGYRSVGQLPSTDALAWHIAAALLGERALRAVNRVRSDGLARLPSILQAALDTIDGRQG